MKQAVIVFNRSYVNAQILEHIQLYTKAFENFGYALEAFDGFYLSHNNDGSINVEGFDSDKYSFTLFWDKDVRLSYALELLGQKVFNNSKALSITDDKQRTYEVLFNTGIKIPFTIVSPLRYPRSNDIDTAFVSYLESKIKYPIIIKENSGSGGEQVFLAANRTELLSIRRKLLYKPHIYQEFVGSAAGADCRYYCIGGEVVAAVRRSNGTDFRSNTLQGGNMQICEPSTECVRLCKNISAMLNLDFGAIDFLQGADGEPILCEVNSNPFFARLLALSGINFASLTAKYISEKI